MGPKVASFRLGDVDPKPVAGGKGPEPEGFMERYAEMVQKDLRMKPSYTDCWVMPPSDDFNPMATYRTPYCGVSVGPLMSGEIEYSVSPLEYGYPDELNALVREIIEKVRDTYRREGGRLDRDSVMGMSRSMVVDRLDEIKELYPDSSIEHLIDDICAIVYRYSVGSGIFEILLTDPHIEDIYVDAPCDSNAIYVTLNGVKGVNSHIRCRTNLMAESREISNLIHILKRHSGLRFSQSNPVLETDVPEFDARATIVGYPMSPLGDAVAIRKHSVRPWTLSRLIYSGAIDPKAAGILSFLVDNRSTFLICGPRGAGKTSLLSALMMENRKETRQLVIEDTPELNCEQMRRVGYKVQSILVDDRIGGDQQSRTDEALRVSLRMGESSIVLGEVRGEEARTLYQSMRAGRAGSSVMGTIHGDSADSVYKRVVTDMGVTPDAFMATDVVVTVGTVRDRFSGRLIRRMNEMVCTGKNPGEFIDISDTAKLTESPLMLRLMRTSQMGKRETGKEIAARGMMRSLLAEAGKIDESYLGPEWILIANEILSENIDSSTADGVTAILRQRIGIKELN